MRETVTLADDASDPTSASSLGGQGIRFHRSSSQEVQDSIQAMGALRTLGSTATVVQGWDYKQNRAIVADVPGHSATEEQLLGHALRSEIPPEATA